MEWFSRSRGKKKVTQQGVWGAWRIGWGISSMEWWCGGGSSIKSKGDGGAFHKTYHGAIMRSPTSLDLPYTWSQAWRGVWMSLHDKRRSCQAHHLYKGVNLIFISFFLYNHDRFISWNCLASIRCCLSYCIHALNCRIDHALLPLSRLCLSLIFCLPISELIFCWGIGDQTRCVILLWSQ